MFAVTLSKAPQAYTKLHQEFKAAVEISADGKTITIGNESAALKRRFAYGFWLSARWEVPVHIPQSVKQDYVMLMPAKHVDTVIDLMASKAAFAHLDKKEVATALQSVDAKDIHSFGIK
jgi:hypothetical protein